MLGLLGDILIVAFILFFVGVWCAITWVISRIGGWHSLAADYPADRTEPHVFRIDGQEPEQRFRWQSLTMGPSSFPTNYGGCVNVAVGKDGILLRVALLFRAFHSPVFLPWQCIDSCETQRVLRFWKRTKVTLHDRPHPICFSGKCGDEIQRVWQLQEGRDSREHAVRAANESI